MEKRLASLFTLFPLVLLAGCGEGSRTLDNIITNGYAAIGSVPFEPPLLYQTGQEWTGPDAELGNRIVARISRLSEERGNPKEIDALWAGYQYDDLVGKLTEREVDFVIGVFGITDSRKEQVAFSRPYYTSELVLMINPNNVDVRPDALGGVDIGVRAGTAAEDLVRSKYPQSNIVPQGTLDDAVLSLKRGEVGAVIADRYLAAYSLATMPAVGYLEVIPEVLGKIDVAVAVRKEDEEFLKLINEIITEAEAEGLYTKAVEGEVEKQRTEVEARHAARLERDVQAVEPRRLLIQVSKEDDYDFDIYRMANLSFTLTEQESGESHYSSKLNFQGRVASSSASVPPGTYRLVLPRMGNWSPGGVTILATDPDRITVQIRLQKGGNVRITRS